MKRDLTVSYRNGPWNLDGGWNYTLYEILATRYWTYQMPLERIASDLLRSSQVGQFQQQRSIPIPVKASPSFIDRISRAYRACRLETDQVLLIAVM